MTTPISRNRASLVGYFDLALVINLKDRADRLRALNAEFARVGWPLGPGGVEVFSACEFSDPAGFTNAAVRGCFHSHLNCLRRAWHKGSENLVVFEDDLALTSALPRLTASIIEQLASNDWGIVYFAYGEDSLVPVASNETAQVELRRFDGELLGGHFYAVSRRALPRLINHLEVTALGSKCGGKLVPMPYDGALNEFRRHNPDVLTLIAAPQLGWQRPSRSDLTPGPYDRNQALQPIIAAVRHLKYLLKRRQR